ncbi:flagellar protein FliT [Dechloromonas sp. ZY10]|uniref:flagellar protein FliT n=1 Tax=Dechloromonas aquae TaxID=2664436 RepID=UPI0035296365
MTSNLSAGGSIELNRLVDTSRRLEHLLAIQAWDDIVELAPEIGQLCEMLNRIELSSRPELLQQADTFIVLEQKIRPLLQERLADLRHELSSQQNTSRLNNIYSP